MLTNDIIKLSQVGAKRVSRETQAKQQAYTNLYEQKTIITRYCKTLIEVLQAPQVGALDNLRLNNYKQQLAKFNIDTSKPLVLIYDYHIEGRFSENDIAILEHKEIGRLSQALCNMDTYYLELKRIIVKRLYQHDLDLYFPTLENLQAEAVGIIADCMTENNSSDLLEISLKQLNRHIKRLQRATFRNTAQDTGATMEHLTATSNLDNATSQLARQKHSAQLFLGAQQTSELVDTINELQARLYNNHGIETPVADLVHYIADTSNYKLKEELTKALAQACPSKTTTIAQVREIIHMLAQD